MATGTLNLPISAAALADGTASNAAPSIKMNTGTNTNPKRRFLSMDFDAATDEFAWFSFRLPSNYLSGGVIKILWMANATTGTCRWSISLGAITPADADTPLEHNQAAVSTAGTAANATEARREVETSITVANLDSAAAGDWITLCLSRDADGTSGTDDLSVDAEVISVAFEYTS